MVGEKALSGMGGILLLTRVVSHTEGRSTHYMIEGDSYQKVADKIEGIRRDSHEYPCTVCFTRPHRAPSGYFRAAGWVDPL